MKSFLFPALVFAGLVGACSSPIEVDGQVFVDSSVGATKIAQADIYVVPEQTLLQNLKALTPKMKAEYERLHALHESNSKYFEKTILLAQALQQLELNRSGTVAFSILNTATASLKGQTALFAKSKHDLDGLGTGANSGFFYADCIQGQTAKTTSDADGRFKLNVDAGERVALVARKDDFYWFLWLAPKKGEPVYLTNKNLNGSDCDACVFSPMAMKGTLSFIAEAVAAAQEN